MTPALEGLLPLPPRSAKPRACGLTHVIDGGLSRLEAEGLMELASPHVDVVRLGWGSALVTAGLERKLDVYRAHGVAPMFGGTLTELVWRHGRVALFTDALVAGVGPERLIFEAPRRGQQAWFVRRFGPDVNLGNVLPGDVISLESLRRGLRSDTLTAFHE